MPELLGGLKIGHATTPDQHSGCTVFLCPEGTIGGVDVRGPAPGSREAILLGPLKTVTTINAVLLTGGSAFGLSAADGVMRYLAERDIGHPTPIRNIPIVAAAVVYDLFLGQGNSLPDHTIAYDACLAAGQGEVAQGNAGAGAGVTIGKWSGFSGIMKGGFGLAQAQDGDLVVGAAAVTNCIGDILNDDGTVLAGARGEDGGWKATADPWRRFPDQPPLPTGTNTTLVVVGTNATMDKISTNRLAERAHDGIAIAVRPAHTSHDGDTAYALATNRVQADFDLVANMVVEMVVEAIRNSVRHASTVGPFVGLKG
jgi:L-aminopeptidase/D-esterase-like protein